MEKREKQLYLAPELELLKMQAYNLLDSLSAVADFEDIDLHEPAFGDIDFDNPS